MKMALKLEEAALFLFTYGATLYLGFSWWLFWAWLLAPDVSMVGYLAGNRTGAVFYNLAHHKGVALVLLPLAWLSGNSVWAFAGLLLLGHSALDRLLGYGLKYQDGFQHTHLGWIGKGRPQHDGLA